MSIKSKTPKKRDQTHRRKKGPHLPKGSETVEFVPTERHRSLVSAMTACGARQEMVAERLGIGLDTLRKHFRVELDNAKAEMCARVGSSLYQRAIDLRHPGGTASAIFIMKTQAHWKETTVQEHKLPPNLGIDWDDGGPGGSSGSAPDPETSSSET